MNNSSIFDNVDWQKEISKEGKPDIDISDDFKPYQFRDVYKEKSEKKKFKGYTVPKEAKDPLNVLKIIPYKTNKAKIRTTPFMDSNIIPHHPSSVCVVGRSGSGKSNFVVNMLTRPEYYKGFFDLTFMFSKTIKQDDLPLYLKLPEKRCFDHFDPKIFNHIMETQEKIIEEKGIHKSPKILILLDDCVSDKKFLTSGYIVKLFIQARHLNISTWMLSQSFTKIPRVCRLQSNSLILFGGTQSEQEILAVEFGIPNTSKKQMLELIQTATREPYSFLTIIMRAPLDKRYRKNLDEYLTI